MWTDQMSEQDRKMKWKYSKWKIAQKNREFNRKKNNIFNEKKNAEFSHLLANSLICWSVLFVMSLSRSPAIAAADTNCCYRYSFGRNYKRASLRL